MAPLIYSLLVRIIRNDLDLQLAPEVKERAFGTEPLACRIGYFSQEDTISG